MRQFSHASLAMATTVSLGILSLLGGLGALVPTTALAQETLKTELLKKGSYDSKIFEDKRQIVPKGKNGLPDGRVTLAKSKDIIASWYTEPTDRYGHGALGDKIEAGKLDVKVRKGPTTQYRLPERQVFEDIAPRIVDLDGDGRMEVVTIVSSLEEGASVGIFGLQEKKPLLEAKASSGFVGKGGWLNIIAFSNFTGGRLQIAYVVKPHVQGKLVIADYIPGQYLKTVAEMEGVSNHIFGSPELRLSAITDFNGDKRGDIIIPSFDRKSLLIIGYVGDQLTPLATASFETPIDKAIHVEGSGEKMRIIVGLEDGTVYAVHR